LTSLEVCVCTGRTEFCTAQTHISKPVKQEVNRTVILPLQSSLDGLAVFSS